MSRIGYVLKRIGKMDFKRMNETANMLHKKTGKSKIWLFADMAKCAAKYNAGYMDYKIAEMYKLNDAQKRTVITRGLSNEIVRRMNDKAYWHFFDDKTEFKVTAGDVFYLPYQSIYTMYIHTDDYKFIFCDFQFVQTEARYGVLFQNQKQKNRNLLCLTYKKASRHQCAEK